jgi:tripartite-type tricarboxylate transporter receptor subunit TctC
MTVHASILHVECIGVEDAAPAITDVLGGHIEVVFNNELVLLTHIKEGKKALAVTGEGR